jgi:hypothetical protein
LELLRNASNARHKDIFSAVNQISDLSKSFIELNDFNNELDRLISFTTVYYWSYKETFQVSRTPKNKVLVNGIKNYEFLKSKNVRLSYRFIPSNFNEFQKFDFEYCIPGYECFDADKVRYFQSLHNAKRSTVECFMAADAYLLEYHCTEANESINQLQDSFFYEIVRSKQLLSQFFSNEEDGLITELIRLYIEVRQGNMDTDAVLELIYYLAGKYKEAVSHFEEKYKENLRVNIFKLNILLSSVKENNSECTASSSSEYIPAELRNSLDRILEFSALPYEKIGYFKSQLDIFRKSDYKNKLESLQPDSRNKITSIYFEIYEAVLKRMLKNKAYDKAIDMFLVFGFMDNGLLTNQQINSLGKLLDMYKNGNNVYSMKRWLSKIYNSEKSPSINEFGVDYGHVLREKRTKEHFVGNGSKTDCDSGNSKLNYEVMNMFKTSHKLCYGQISTYFPVLHRDMLPNDISTIAVTSGKIDRIICSILNIDFSAFYREVFYSGDNPAFKKELVIKQVLPDIVLVPTIGTKAIMWQEITGQSKITPGRFIIPIFTLEDLSSLVIKLIGNFRWELSRTVAGDRWNDITRKTLTSEYADYIQGYKKNKNLSQENKERIKTQIQRHRNNLRDIFTSDYEIWIKYEAKGIKKVNKEVWSILYKYCPFNRWMREDLIGQPVFTDVAAQFEKERRKFTQDLEGRYAYYVKQGHVLEPELEENLRYYKEL